MGHCENNNDVEAIPLPKESIKDPIMNVGASRGGQIATEGIIHPDILTTNFPIHSSGLTYSQNSLLTNKVPTNKNRDKKINSKTNSPVNKVQNVQYPVYQNLTPLNVNVNNDHDSDISEGHDNRTKNNKESSPTKMTNNQYNTSPKSSSYVPMAALLSASAQIKNIKDNNNPPQRSSNNNNNDDNQNSQ